MAAIDEKIIRAINAHKNELSTRFHVESLSIFGSVSRGTAGPASDVDILVRYRETPGLFSFLELKQYLEAVIGRPVDLVTEGALKKQLRQHILQEAIRVA
jgi:predicted nucleotidyltransferase